KSHRCIVPASYYFEWEHIKINEDKTKTGRKFMFQPKGSTTTWLCGIYRMENSLPVFAVLTREPSEELSHFHDRMPLILPEEMIDNWISPQAVPEDLMKYALTDMVYELSEDHS
ncbi:MAG: SOS response-associated peptidase, partial [Lachnospiraceae bacterium]|nr:SOS response-associated peptidase [Lachnospiraceae bacterium]